MSVVYASMLPPKSLNCIITERQTRESSAGRERLLQVSSYAAVAVLASSMMCDLWNHLALAAARPVSGPPTQPSHLMTTAPF